MPQGKNYALVVEDDIGQREMVVVLLENAGFEVLQSDTAEAAMIILQQAGRDLSLLVSDVRLNGGGAACEISSPAVSEHQGDHHLRQGMAGVAGRRDVPAQAVEPAGTHTRGEGRARLSRPPGTSPTLPFVLLNGTR